MTDRWVELAEKLDAAGYWDPLRRSIRDQRRREVGEGRFPLDLRFDRPDVFMADGEELAEGGQWLALEVRNPGIRGTIEYAEGGSPGVPEPLHQGGSYLKVMVGGLQYRAAGDGNYVIGSGDEIHIQSRGGTARLTLGLVLKKMASKGTNMSRTALTWQELNDEQRHVLIEAFEESSLIDVLNGWVRGDDAQNWNRKGIYVRPLARAARWLVENGLVDVWETSPDGIGEGGVLPRKMAMRIVADEANWWRHDPSEDRGPRGPNLVESYQEMPYYVLTATDVARSLGSH